MTILGFDHYAVRTARYSECLRFYTEVLGLAIGPRPPLSVEGVWLYQGSEALVHLVDASSAGAAVPAEAGESPQRGSQAGPMDHIAFRACDLDAMIERLDRHGVEYRRASIPAINLRQLFIADPDGVVIELNFVD